MANNQETLDNIKVGFMEFFGTVTELVQAFITAFKGFWSVYGDTIMTQIKIVWDTIVGVFKGAFAAVQGVFKIFTGIFQGDWKKVWEGVKQTFGGVWDGIVSIAKGAVNLIINTMNGMINGLNRLKWEVPSWIPVLGGKSWGFNLAKIPLLAEGGDINRGGMAIVGDAGPELLELPTGARVTPLSKSEESTTVNNISYADMFRGATFHIRDDKDIEKLGNEFHQKQQAKLRAVGEVQ